jgi:hypothetical protein
MNNDSELMTAVQESFAGFQLNAPVDATIRRGQELRRRRRMACAAGGAGVVLVAGAGLLVTTGLASSGAGHPFPHGKPSARLAAWTVTTGPDDTVNILIRQLSDPAGLQDMLRADGVPAVVAFQKGELSDTPPLPGGCKAVAMSDEANAQLQEKIVSMPPSLDDQALALTINTGQIPRGIGLNLTVQSSGDSYGWSLGLVQATAQCTGSSPTASPKASPAASPTTAVSP